MDQNGDLRNDGEGGGQAYPQSAGQPPPPDMQQQYPLPSYPPEGAPPGGNQSGYDNPQVAAQNYNGQTAPYQYSPVPGFPPQQWLPTQQHHPATKDAPPGGGVAAQDGNAPNASTVPGMGGSAVASSAEDAAPTKMKIDEPVPAGNPGIANLMSIVVGNSPKKRVKEEMTPSSILKPEPKSPTSGGLLPQDVKGPGGGKAVEKPPKRRRRLVPLKKVLVARKEKDMAVTLMHDKRDLASVLAKEECIFLGYHFWVFTQQQLMFALGADEVSDPKLAKQRSDIQAKLVKYLSIAAAVAAESKEGDDGEFDLAAVVTTNPRKASKHVPTPLLDRHGQPMLGVDTEALRQSIDMLVDGGYEGEQRVTNELNQGRYAPLVNVVQTKGPEYNMFYAKPDLYEAQQAANAYLATGVPGIGYSKNQSAIDQVPNLYSGPLGIQEMPPPADNAAAPPRAAVEVMVRVIPPSVNMPVQNHLSTPNNSATPEAAANTKEGEAKLKENSKEAGSDDKPTQVFKPVIEWKDEDWLSFKPKAEEKMGRWRELVKVSLAQTDPTSPQERFKVDEAISFLFSPALRNFFASVPFKHLYDFMELKKTETGGVCDLVRVWREKCNLSPMSSAAIAKHLLGVGTRMELAISSIPPVSEKDREWVNDPIIVMTGAAQEFLIGHLNITSGKRFVQVRTKDLSTDLVKWRHSRRMPPLKGSGKVAMISGWKAAVKDAIEAEEHDGKTLKGVNLMKLAELEIEVAPAPVMKPLSKEGASIKKGSDLPTTSKRAPSISTEVEEPELNREGRYALHSPLLLEDALGDDATFFLKSISIGSAAALLDASKSRREELLKQLVDGKKAQEIEGASALLVTWIGRVRHELKQFEVKKKVAKSQKEAKGHARRIVPSELRDPIEALSSITQAFLESMGITTAEDFLSSRTTDIANEFVKFRIREGMPELKGLGAIASVSGWKAQVRKVATKMGMHDVSKLEPESMKQREAIDAKPTSSRSRKSSGSSIPKPSFLPSRPDLLRGEASQSLQVHSCEQFSKAYTFDVSLRSGEIKSPAVYKPFITYIGASAGGTDEGCEARQFLDDGGAKIPILSKSAAQSVQTSVDHYSSFKSESKGVGCVPLVGVDLRPFDDQDLSILKNEIASFVLLKEPPPVEKSSDCALDHNVLLGCKHIGEYEPLFFCKSLMEKGEIQRLKFLTVSNYISLSRSKPSFDARSLLDCAMNLLSRADLLQLTEFLAKELLLNINAEVGQYTQDTIVSKVVSRKRTDWVFRRVTDAFGAEFPRNETLITNSRQLDEQVPNELKPHVSQKIAEERRQDLESALLLNSAYLHIRNNYWCPLLQRMVSKLAETAAIPADWETTQKFVAAFKDYFQPDPIVADCVQDEQVLCVADGEAAAASQFEKKNANEVGNGFSLAKDAYRAMQLALAKVVALCVITLNGREGFDFDVLLDSLQRAADLNCGVQVQLDIVKSKFLGCPLPLPKTSTPTQVTSYQYFLCLVWPSLRKQGWRMHVGATPSEISFVTPNGAATSDRQSKTFKMQQQRKRVRLSSDAYNVGLGSSMKLTRRLCISTSAQYDKNSKANTEVDTSVQDIADQYLFQLQESLEGNPSETQDRAGDIVKSFVVCFDEIATSLPNFNVELGEKKASEACGGEHLVQFLFILPTILRQSKLPLPQVNRSLDLAQDMMSFVTKNYKSQLDDTFCPSIEVYSNEVKPPPSAIAAGLRSLDNINPEDNPDNDGTVVPVLTETVLEEDKKDLTDFIVQVLSQSVPCRATDEDTTKKYRRIHVGFPGLMCRHCRGNGGEGRYFFTSPDSVATAATVFEKHVAKCSAIPASIKQSVVKARERHTGQRKSQAQGLQHKFFVRLWERLRSSNIEGELSGALVFPKTVESLAAVADYSDNSRSFSDHVDVMDFVRSELLPDYRILASDGGLPVCKRTSSLADSVNQYYQCIEYGSRTYGTPSMPKHFSSEWLLSKIVPRRKTPKKLMAG